MKHLLERGVIVIHILEEPLLGELWLGQGRCERLDINLHEVVGVGLITCEELGFVNWIHLLLGGRRSVTTLKIMEKVREDCKRLKMIEEKRNSDGMKSSKLKSNAYCMCG